MQDKIEICPLRHVMDIVGGKWKMPILCVLAMGGTVRYGQVRKKIPSITNMMLAQSLKELEEHGLVHREQYNEVPPRVEYSLTGEGERIMPVIRAIGAWGRENLKHQEGLCSHCEDCAVIKPDSAEIATQ